MRSQNLCRNLSTTSLRDLSSFLYKSPRSKGPIRQSRPAVVSLLLMPGDVFQVRNASSRYLQAGSQCTSSSSRVSATDHSFYLTGEPAWPCSRRPSSGLPDEG